MFPYLVGYSSQKIQLATRFSYEMIEVMPAKKHKNKPLVGKTLIKEVNRRIRLARSQWDAHNNKACRRERERAIQLYETLDKDQREKVPQPLRVWLRYRSEKYFGEHRTKPGDQPPA
ncbi:MAG: hypothetical protein ACI9FG_000292 [Crocinitomicaceae bacterium]|jgi:hypothetical protein